MPDSELFNEYEETIRAKWTIDGAKTLEEAAECLEAEAKRYRKLAADGWELTGPVEDDYGFIRQKK